MEELINTLTKLSFESRVALLLGSLLMAIILESLIPYIEFRYEKLKHVGTNMVFLITSGAASFSLAFLAYEVINIADLQFGLFFTVKLPLWLQLIASLVVLDFFGQYLVHVCLHKYKWMWKFHLVHHSDTTVDASTGTRHHPGDILIRETLIFIVIVLIGIPLAFYILYRIVTPAFAYFTHANIRLPTKVDKALSWIIVTPHMHKFHHHYQRPWTNNNYGNIFSFWDRMFGTFFYSDAPSIHYGLDTVEGRHDMKLSFQFALPFNKDIKTDY